MCDWVMTCCDNENAEYTVLGDRMCVTLHLLLGSDSSSHHPQQTLCDECGLRTRLFVDVDPQNISDPRTDRSINQSINLDFNLSGQTAVRNNKKST